MSTGAGEVQRAEDKFTMAAARAERSRGRAGQRHRNGQWR